MTRSLLDYAEMIPAPGPWADKGLCKGHTREFFPNNRWETTAARALCATCPVSAQCLAYALKHDMHGIWAGTTEQDRRRMRRPR